MTHIWIPLTRTLNNSNLVLTSTFFDSPPGSFLLILPSITQTPNNSNLFSISLECSNCQDSTLFSFKYNLYLDATPYHCKQIILNKKRPRTYYQNFMIILITHPYLFMATLFNSASCFIRKIWLAFYPHECNSWVFQSIDNFAAFQHPKARKEIKNW